MGTIELRSELISIIQEIEDDSLLKALYVVITHNPVHLKKRLKWEELPETLKKEIEEGLEQSENGEVIGHDEVMKKYKKWL
jgi:predicted transcriptional regulator